MKTLKNLINLALAEDLGRGDLTTQALFSKNSPSSKAKIITRQQIVVAGIEIAKQVFKKVDPQLKVKAKVKDGNICKAGSELISLSGSASSILTAERCALNFLQHLCGIATHTYQFVQAVKGTQAKILDTRKTLPGWRELQKQAVKLGGAVNHRFGLYDAYLIKDNHLALFGSITQALEAAKKHRGKRKYILEIEADNLEQFEEALLSKPDVILLDNMPLEDMRLAVLKRQKVGLNKKVKLEASGNVNLHNVRAIAQTGVDYISIGALTHSVKAVDLSLEM